MKVGCRLYYGELGNARYEIKRRSRFKLQSLEAAGAIHSARTEKWSTIFWDKFGDSSLVNTQRCSASPFRPRFFNAFPSV